jgi:DNA polymerase-3 subunit epsilon
MRKITKTLSLIIDVESTGLDVNQDQIIELGGSYFFGEHRYGPALQSRVKPSIPIPADSTKIHGITDEDVKDAPPWSVISQWLKKHVDVEPIISGYNILWYDSRIINAENKRHGLDWQLDLNKLLDPIIFAKWFHPERQYNLKAMCASYGISLPEHKAHSADADTIATGMLQTAMCFAGTIPDDLDTALSWQRELKEMLDEEEIRWGRRLYVDRVDRKTLRIAQGIHRGKSFAEVGEDFFDGLLKETNPKEVTEEAKSAINHHFKKQIAMF